MAKKKKFLDIGSRGQYYKTFWGIIYATSGVFPYDFDWGYTDSDVIMPKKKIYNIDSRSPFRTPQSNTSVVSSVNRTSLFAEATPGRFVSIVEGRGSARGEIGIASISLTSPTLVLCQFSDTRAQCYKTFYGRKLRIFLIS